MKYNSFMCSSNLLLHIFLKHFSLLYLPTCDMIMISFYPEIGGISHPVLILRSISSSDPPQIPLGSCFFFERIYSDPPQIPLGSFFFSHESTASDFS